MSRQALVEDVFEWAGTVLDAVPELAGVRLVLDERQPWGMAVKEDDEIEFDGSFALICPYYAEGVGRDQADRLLDAFELAVFAMPYETESSDLEEEPEASRSVETYRGDCWVGARRVADGRLQITIGIAHLPDDGLASKKDGGTGPDWSVPSLLVPEGAGSAPPA